MHPYQKLLVGSMPWDLILLEKDVLGAIFIEGVNKLGSSIHILILGQNHM